MEPEIEEIDAMVVEGAGGESHHKEHKQDTRESSVLAEGTADGMIDACNCIENKENNDELGDGAFAGNNTSVDPRENVGGVENQEKETLNDEHDKEGQLTGSVDMQNSGAGLASEEGVNEMFTVSEDDIRDETVVGNSSNQDMGEAKKVLKRKKVVKKIVKRRRLVKGKVTAKDEEEPQPSEMPEPSVQVPTNQNVKNKEDVQNKEAGLASDEGVNEMFTVSEDDIRDETVIGNSSNQDTREAKDLECLTDSVTSNAEEIANDDTNTAKEGLLDPEKKVLKRKKVVKKIVKKRRLVKGKVTAKDEEEPQSSEMPEPSVQVPTNQNVKNTVDMENKGSGLASDEGVNEMFTVSEEGIREETVIGNSSNLDTREAKDLETRTDAFTLNGKEEITNDDANTTNEVLLAPKKKVLKPKTVVRKVVKRRKLVKGKVLAKDEEEPQSSEMPEPSVKVQSNQNANNEENPDAKPMDNVNSSSTRRAKKKNADQITDEVAIKSKQSEKNKQAGKEKVASESKNVGDMKEEAKSKLRKMSSKKAEPSEKHKSSNEVETMGMIFMCSSKTKEDCYRYKIFGLPASKKDVVLKVYDGMKLFLFDIRLKLLYGIYKAAGPGGYNIEPKAFHSNFPSQVRFSIVDDCNPLPEAKFKKVIQDNYYSKNKFSAELNSKQVNSLCELFLVSKNGTMSKAKAVTERPNVGIRPTVEIEKKRKARVENEVNRGTKKRRVVVESEKDLKGRRVVDDVKHSKGKGNVIRPRINGDVRRPRAKFDVGRPKAENDARRLRLEDDARRLGLEEDAIRLRLEEDARRLRLEDDARRSRANDDARRSRANDGARRSRGNDGARRSRANDGARRSRGNDGARRSRDNDGARRSRAKDGARRSRAKDDARRSRAKDDARRLRLEYEERRLRLEDAIHVQLEDDARHLRAENDARVLRVEEDARHLLADDRRRYPHTLNDSYPLRADVYEREAYLPSALPTPLHLDTLPPPAVPTYTSSYTYGRTSVLDDYRSDVTIGHEDRGLASSGLRPLYEYESRDRYLPYSEPIEYRHPEYLLDNTQIYSPTAPRDKYLPSTSRMSRYRDSPYRRY